MKTAIRLIKNFSVFNLNFVARGNIMTHLMLLLTLPID